MLSPGTALKLLQNKTKNSKCMTYYPGFSVKASQPNLCIFIFSCFFPTVKNTLFFVKMCVKVSVIQRAMPAPSLFLNFYLSPILNTLLSLTVCPDSPLQHRHVYPLYSDGSATHCWPMFVSHQRHTHAVTYLPW